MVERSIRLASLAVANEDSPRFFYLAAGEFPHYGFGESAAIRSCLQPGLRLHREGLSSILMSRSKISVPSGVRGSPDRSGPEPKSQENLRPNRAVHERDYLQHWQYEAFKAHWLSSVSISGLAAQAGKEETIAGKRDKPRSKTAAHSLALRSVLTWLGPPCSISYQGTISAYF
jgi:hypothetical protein